MAGRGIRSLCAVVAATAVWGASEVYGDVVDSITSGVEGGRPATRGHSFQATTPTPDYATGECDPHSGGLALEPGAQPNDLRAIGGSVEARTIWAEHWGPVDAPQIIVVGQIHGNECAPITVTRMARAFGWRHVGIWLIPTLNPDGYVRFSRFNAHDEDLNADGYHVAQPETVALLEFTARIRPVLSVHVHSPNGFVGWYGSPTAARVATDISAVTGLRYTTAGTRTGRNWFVWQAQQQVARSGAVLVEVNPLVRWEAKSAWDRAPMLSRAELEDLATRAWSALDAAFAE